jgi:hypothetical protein
MFGLVEATIPLTDLAKSHNRQQVLTGTYGLDLHLTDHSIPLTFAVHGAIGVRLARVSSATSVATQPIWRSEP